MAELSLVYEEKLEHDGIFHLKDFYKFMRTWFEYYHYFLQEKKYEEK